jgi:hypothetical protein
MADLTQKERANAFRRIANELRDVAHHIYCSGQTRQGEELEAIADQVAALATPEEGGQDG